MKKNAKGFTLIELLIVVAIIGIIVAIAIPNLLNAIQRAKQRRTMGDIRTSATAIEAYAVDMNRYPPAAGSYDLPADLNTGVTVGNGMYKYVSPTYVKAIPLADGWNSWFIYSTDGNGTVYALFSGAKDGSAMGPTGTPIGPTTDFNSDIVYANGSFLQWPEGVQR